MDPLLIAGGVTAGVYLAETDPSVLGLDNVPAGNVEIQTGGKALAAAMGSLRAGGDLLSTSYQVDPGNSAINTYNAMRAALVAQYTAVPNASGAQLPRGLTQVELAEVMTAWLSAYDAGLAADPLNFAKLQGSQINLYAGQPCSIVPREALTTIGAAACDLSAYRDTITDQPYGDDNTKQALSLVLRLASEMDGNDYVTPGVRPSEQGLQLSNVPGALAAAGSATADFVGGIAGTAIGAVAGAIVGSPLFWAAGLGFVAYLVFRR